jgi:hypothetical protein
LHLVTSFHSAPPRLMHFVSNEMHFDVTKCRNAFPDETHFGCNTKTTGKKLQELKIANAARQYVPGSVSMILLRLLTSRADFKPPILSS